MVPDIAEQLRNALHLVEPACADLELDHPVPPFLLDQLGLQCQDLDFPAPRAAFPSGAFQAACTCSVWPARSRCRDAAESVQKALRLVVRDISDRMPAHIVIRDKIGRRLMLAQNMARRIAALPLGIDALPAVAAGEHHLPPVKDLVHLPAPAHAVLRESGLPALVRVAPGALC